MIAFGVAKAPSPSSSRLMRPASPCVSPRLFNSGVCSRREERTRLHVISELVGASEETGGVFDPLGLATDETSLYRRRVAELKHGRVGMLATVGAIVQSFVHLPDPERSAFSNSRPIGALIQVWRERPSIIVAMVATMGVIELTIGRENYGAYDAEPGQLGGFWQSARPRDPKVWRRRQLQELKHGRLAALAITGILAQELVTHEGPVEQLVNGHINPFAHY